MRNPTTPTKKEKKHDTTSTHWHPSCPSSERQGLTAAAHPPRIKLTSNTKGEHHVKLHFPSTVFKSHLPVNYRYSPQTQHITRRTHKGGETICFLILYGNTFPTTITGFTESLDDLQTSTSTQNTGENIHGHQNHCRIAEVSSLSKDKAFHVSFIKTQCKGGEAIWMIFEITSLHANFSTQLH